jgi:hypothetical protein
MSQFAERSMTPFGIQKAVEELITECMGDKFMAKDQYLPLEIPSNDKSRNIEIVCTKYVDHGNDTLLEARLRVRKKDGRVYLTILPTFKFKIEIDLEGSTGDANSLNIGSYLPASLDEHDMKKVICHLMSLARTTTCFECGELTTMSEGLCGSCMSRTTEQDFARDGTTDVCAICQSCVDIPIYRKRTNCCRQLVHKRCCAAAVFANRRNGSNRLACFNCRSKKFHNTTYTLEDDDTVDEEVEVDEDDDDDDNYIDIC